ncbi:MULTISPECIES: DUF4235 domain-containing protein [Aeromicrobium]|jgi:hypothetical protein|uniref:DUF4235 domain-containing protein n=1 Tax=Aeromicrobium phoceense TaxID=2754045 RepID=A0A838XC00_9ACTN|nr:MULTISPECIES: DUF4235 domain-containing protein [Aeromicrobium]MBA4607432.1 DUF4235 domain-containing protein [Aeromicrobium phoceense]
MAAPKKAKASTSAKILYQPVGLITSILAGLIASAVFKQVWKRASPNSEGDPPNPTQSEFPLKEILLAAVIQGAIFSGVRAIVQRQGAKAFAKATGEWPGD